MMNELADAVLVDLGELRQDLVAALDLSAELAPARQALIANYADGLARWRAREFELAAQCFDRSAATDRPAALFCERARELAQKPPGGDWEPIRTLQEK